MFVEKYDLYVIMTEGSVLPEVSNSGLLEHTESRRRDMKRDIAGVISFLLAIMGGVALVSLPVSEAAPGKPNQAETKKPAKNKPRVLKQFMRRKLSAANEVLEGIVTEDFDQILLGAASLKRISGAAEWLVSKDLAYRQFSTSFQRKVDRLTATAKQQNLDGATLAYIEVTMSCVECHKWIRSTLIADSPTATSLRGHDLGLPLRQQLKITPTQAAIAHALALHND
jgi:hypothetical protein